MNACKIGTKRAPHYLQGKEPSGFTLSGTYPAGIREMETGILAYSRLLRYSRTIWVYSAVEKQVSSFGAAQYT